MRTVRPMEFAGSWYPATAEACARRIEAWWADPPAGAAQSGAARSLAAGGPAAPRLGVVPHAGWTYSGRLTAGVVQGLGPSPAVTLAVVLGGHLHPTDPVVAMTAGAWDTPFGPLPLHTDFGPVLDALEQAGRLRVRRETPLRYAADNSTEVQLPFVRHAFPLAEVLVLRVPPGPAALVLGAALADYLERYLAQPGRAAVGLASTDLTHYGPAYRFEPHGRGAAALRWVREENDPAFIDAVAHGDSTRLLEMAARRHNACSAGAVAALNEVARRRQQRFAPLDYATSDDVKPGDSLNFVGYVGGLFA